MTSYFATLEIYDFLLNVRQIIKEYYSAYTVYKQRHVTARGLNGDRMEREVKPVTGLE